MFEQRAIDTSILDTWDALVVERFDLLRSAGSTGRDSCELTVSSQCLVSLDRTVDELWARIRGPGTDAKPSGSEQIALRSAAIEVATEAYVDRLAGRGRRRDSEKGRATRDQRAKDANARDVIERAVAQGRGASVMCSLPPALLRRLDEVVDDLLERNDVPLGENGVTRAAMRSVVVESALTAWLILRGSSSVVPHRQPPRTWLSSVARLARARAFRSRRRTRGRE